jgi:subtilisin family serine protease
MQGAAQIHRIRSVDANHDKLFDTLDNRLARLGARRTVGIIAVLNQPATPALVERLSARAGGLQSIKRFTVIDGFSARATREQARALARRPEVAHVELNGSIQVTNDTPQEYYGVSAARAQVPGLDGNNDGNANAYTKNDLVAAVLDTGIDTTHLDLTGKVIGWNDLVNGRTTPYDDNGHGTHVAATLAGSGNATPDRKYRGVAPGAALVGVKVTPADGVAIMSNVIAGLQWVVANKATYNIKVVNLSLGAPGCWDGTEAVSQAVNSAVAAGLVVVVAAGNASGDLCTVKAPGAAAGAITVGNMADPGAGGFFLRYDSGRGPTADGRMKPDVVAPGYQVESAAAGTTNGYKLMDGTSMATPFVSGLALLMLEQKPALTAVQIKDALHATAVDWGRGGDSSIAGSKGPDVDYGWGRLDAFAALKSIGAPVTTAPPVPGHQELEGSLSGTGKKIDLPISISNVSYPVAATLTIPNASATKNFNLSLISPTGVELATSTRTDRTDFVVGRIDTPGTYLLRITSAAGTGDFFVDVSGGFGLPSGNLLVNGSFETGLTGWAGDSASTTLSLANDGKAGLQAAKVTRGGTLSTYSIVSTPHPLTYTKAGQSFVGDAWVRSAAGTRTICEAIRELSATGTLYGSAQKCVFAGSSWVDVPNFSYTTKRDGSELELSVTQSNARTGDSFEVDGLALSAGAGPADTTPPDTLITGGPTNPSASTSPSFTFVSSEAGSTFQCSLDAGAYAACTSPKSYSSLSLAQHTFRVRAVDSAGKVDASPAVQTWTIMAPWPETTITSAPTDGVTDTSATIAFTSDTAGAHFECALDGGTLAACASPKSYSGLAVGQHTVTVRAINSSNTADVTPATATWTIAATPVAGPNLVPNAGFESGTTGWSYFAGTLAAATDGMGGGPALLVTAGATATSFSAYAIPRPVKSLTAGTAYVASGYLRSSSPGKSTCLNVRELSGSTVVGSAASCLVATGTWQQFPPVSYTAKQTGTSLDLNVMQSPAVGGDSFEIDSMSLNGPPDTTAPDTTITSAPSSSSSTSATVAFTASETSTFECSLDGAAFAACASPASLTGLTVGQHTFSVRAKDLAGNIDQSPATATWTVNPPAPDTTITSAPANGVTDTSATIAFASPDAGATFECALDGAAFAACASPLTVTGLAVGQHTFQVRALAGATADPTPASATWTIAAPAAAGPNVLTNAGFESGTAGWSFFASTLSVATDAKAGSQALLVALDPASTSTSFSAYAIPRPARNLVLGATYTASGYVRSDKPGKKVCLNLRELASGTVVGTGPSCLTTTGTWQQFPPVSYTAKQAGTDLDLNVMESSAAAGDSFEIDSLSLNGPPDTTAPETTISGSPADSTSTTASIAFTASEAGTFECSLDGAAFSSCSSPASLSGLAVGPHAFQVRATDLAGNVDQTPASASWNVLAPADTTPPDTTITQVPPATTADTSAKLAFTATESGTFQCSIDGTAWASCASPQTFDGLAAGQHTVQARAVDAASNIDPTPASATWTVVASTPGAPNLLANGGFETGLGGWSSWQAALSTATDAVDGTQAALVSANAGVTSFSISAAPRPVRTGLTAGDSYGAAGYLRSDSPGKKVCLTLREWDAAGAVAGSANSCLIATGSWQRIPSVAYTVKGTGGQLDLYAIVTNASGADTFEVDGLSLRVLSAPSDTTAPETTITSGPPSWTLDTTASIAFSSSEPGVLECSLDGEAFAGCTSPRALGGLAVGQHTFQVRAIDAAGNVDQTPASTTWAVMAAPSGANLLANGGFESGVGGWSPYQGTLALATDAQEGSQAVKVSANAGATVFSITTAPRPVRASTVAGTLYGGNGWVRSDTPGKKVCLRLREWAAGAQVAQVSSCVTTTGSWQQFPQALYRTTQSGGDLELYVTQSPSADGDTFELDGLSLQKSS